MAKHFFFPFKARHILKTTLLFIQMQRETIELRLRIARKESRENQSDPTPTRRRDYRVPEGIN